jgi:hypothetical protein
MEAGLDSLGAVELRNSLATRFDLELAPTLTFDYPTASALAGHLTAILATAGDDETTATEWGPDDQGNTAFDLEEVIGEVASIVMSVLGTAVLPEQVSGINPVWKAITCCPPFFFYF